MAVVVQHQTTHTLRGHGVYAPHIPHPPGSMDPVWGQYNHHQTPIPCRHQKTPTPLGSRRASWSTSKCSSPGMTFLETTPCRHQTIPTPLGSWFASWSTRKSSLPGWDWLETTRTPLVTPSGPALRGGGDSSWVHSSSTPSSSSLFRRPLFVTRPLCTLLEAWLLGVGWFLYLS